MSNCFGGTRCSGLVVASVETGASAGEFGLRNRVHQRAIFIAAPFVLVLPLRRRLGRSFGPLHWGDFIRPRHEPANGALFYLTNEAAPQTDMEQSPGHAPHAMSV